MPNLHQASANDDDIHFMTIMSSLYPSDWQRSRYSLRRLTDLRPTPETDGKRETIKFNGRQKTVQLAQLNDAYFHAIYWPYSYRYIKFHKRRFTILERTHVDKRHDDDKCAMRDVSEATRQGARCL